MSKHKYLTIIKSMHDYVLHVVIFKFLDSGLRKRNAVHGTVADVASIQSALNVSMMAILIY